MLLHKYRGSRAMSRGQPMGFFPIASVWSCVSSDCIYLTVECLVTSYVYWTMHHLDS